MAVNVSVTVEDIAAKIAVPYNRIELERATSVGGAYANITNITLVAATYYYSYADTTGTVNSWYRYRFSDSGAAPSDYSNPFRPTGATRLKIRQELLKAYRIGDVFTATGGDADTVISTDYRIKSTAYAVGRGKGQWLLPTTGNGIGVPGQIKSDSAPSTGTFNVELAWAGVIVSGDEIEWHWLVNPDVANDCINRGLRRYYYLDRVPLVGVADSYEYDLASLPWLVNEEDITGLWYTPNSINVERHWGAYGNWWEVRQDSDSIKLMISPAIDSSYTLYLEALRPMPELYTDASVAPTICDIELAAAFAWDEVLAYLSRPLLGSGEEREAWKAERVLHSQGELKRLIAKNRLRPRAGPPRGSSPPTYIQPYRAR